MGYPMRGKDHSNHVKTSNRFSCLRDGEEDMEDILHSSRRPDSSPARKKLRIFCFEDFGDFCRKNSKVILSHLFDNSISMMYNNKSNMCSGYFPEFILDPYLDNFNLNDNDVSKNGPPNFNTYIDYYYPHVKGNKYSKQISNANSKYNNSYFLKKKPIYKICKKFWGPSKNLRSLDSNSLKSKYNNKTYKTIPKTLKNNDYDRVVMSSDRGTLEKNNIPKDNNNNTFYNKPNKNFYKEGAS